ncbi:MAG: VOC family protein [Ginsengibacter sp.]
MNYKRVISISIPCFDTNVSGHARKMTKMLGFYYRLNSGCKKIGNLTNTYINHAMENKPSIIINHLQHAGIPVTDIGISEVFYNRLGFANVMQSVFTIDDETGTCIMMENNGVIIELYQLPLHKIEEIRNRSDGHIDHIAFDVDDIDNTFTSLKDASFHIIESAPVMLSFWKKGCKYFNITGPDGERLEFNQIIR